VVARTSPCHSPTHHHEDKQIEEEDEVKVKKEEEDVDELIADKIEASAEMKPDQPAASLKANDWLRFLKQHFNQVTLEEDAHRVCIEVDGHQAYIDLTNLVSGTSVRGIRDTGL
jgi:hypothetical protein